MVEMQKVKFIKVSKAYFTLHGLFYSHSSLSQTTQYNENSIQVQQTTKTSYSAVQ